MLAFFFFNDTATTEIYTLSLHDALPIWCRRHRQGGGDDEQQEQRDTSSDRTHRSPPPRCLRAGRSCRERSQDRKSTRLNSSHSQISYAVFCFKKKKTYNLISL